MARPTKYTPAILEKTKKYIKLTEDEDVQVVKQENGEKGYIMYENKLKVRLPSIEGLAFYLKVNKDTIHEWKKIHKKFSDLIRELLAKQGELLINKGLSGEYNSTIAKLLLSKHGFREKIDITKDSDLTEEDLSEY